MVSAPLMAVLTYLDKTITLYESALKLISQNTDTDIDEFSLRLNIAELKSQTSPEEALEEFRKINYMGIADINIAMIYMNTGKLDEAMDRLTRVHVSILIKCLRYSSNMAITLLKPVKGAILKKPVPY